MKAPDYRSGMINLAILSLLALVLMGLMINSWMAGDYNGASAYMGLLFIDFGMAIYSFRVAVIDGSGYKEVDG